MATPTLTAHFYPTSGVTTGSGVAWTNPGNAISENATSATSALTKSATTSQTLRVTGFDFSSIPTGSMITGVEVRIKRSTAGNTVNDNSVRLSLSGASIGTNLASATNYTTSLAWATYGGANELWGTTLTEAQVKDSTFGVDFSAKLSGTTGRTVSVDAISVSIAYLLPGAYLEATDGPDSASFTVTVPVVASMNVSENGPDTASFRARARTGSVVHVGTGPIASATNSTGAGAPITIPLPDGWMTNDIFIMHLTVESGAGPASISGWTPIATVGNTSLYWRRAEAGDTAPTFAVNPSYSLTARGSISAWGDALWTGDPIESVATGSATPPYAGTAACPDVTVTSVGSMIFSVANYTAGSISFVSPFTNIHQIGGTYATATTATMVATTTGTQSGGSFGSSYSSGHSTGSFVLKPAPSGEPEPTVASLIATDGPDTASFTAAITGTATLSATDGPDTASFTATVGSASVDFGFVKSGGAWVQPSKVYVKNAGSWIEPTSIFVKKSGVWTLVKGTP